MVTQTTLQIRKIVGIHTVSRKMTLMRVMFGLALCVLVGAMAPAAAAWRGNDSIPPQRLYVRQANGIQFSDDGGISWAQAGALPSRPLAMVVAGRTSSPGTAGVVFVGTESVGLLRSDDGGASWQPVDSTVLSGGNAAPLAVTALAVDPEDARIVYAATNIWLGTNPARLTPLGVAVSVDGGGQWLQLSTASLSDAPVRSLEPVAGRPLTVVTGNDTGRATVSLKTSPALLGLLQDGDAAVRASAARAIGLIGDLVSAPAPLPSRPLAMAVAPRASSAGTPGVVFVGTESAGLLRSNDGGASWQPVDSTVLSGGNTAPLAVTAVAIDPQDQQIVYAATNIWLGTNPARLTPVGIAVSVDGGRQWLQFSHALLSDAPLLRLQPVADRSLTVVTVNSTGSSNAVNMVLSPGLVSMLQDSAPAVRASAARAIGLIGDPAALPGLMQVLADPDALAGQRIAEAIGRIGDRSVSAALLNLLGSAPAVERTRAALALGMLQSTEAVPGLAALLNAGDPGAQRVAAEALATIGTPAAMAALTAPLADQAMTSARHAAMGGLETAGPAAVASLTAALRDSGAVVRANAAEMLGWLKPAGAVADLTPLLSDQDPAVRAQAAWALGEIGTEAARLALITAPLSAPLSAPILAPITARPVVAKVPVVVPAAAVSLPETLADITADDWTLAVMMALFVLVLLAIVMIGKGPRRPTTHLGPA